MVVIGATDAPPLPPTVQRIPARRIRQPVQETTGHCQSKAPHQIVHQTVDLTYRCREVECPRSNRG